MLVVITPRRSLQSEARSLKMKSKYLMLCHLLRSACKVAMRDLVLKQIVFYFASHLLQSKPWLLLNLVAMPKKNSGRII
ncbi:hypothetical protein L1987_16405 [Smallanthus sonchifolius]|uniref:Uncharacterized protein n=1 Tax=Smallanthus sonchifolius TaxID=185202 RepID=A0ACB9JAE2_9ASTR|nr:hypothetical protein L1987_16405 [Smallanthus sonchifolius]